MLRSQEVLAIHERELHNTDTEISQISFEKIYWYHYWYFVYNLEGSNIYSLTDQNLKLNEAQLILIKLTLTLVKSLFQLIFFTKDCQNSV